MDYVINCDEFMMCNVGGYHGVTKKKALISCDCMLGGQERFIYLAELQAILRCIIIHMASHRFLYIQTQ